MSKQILHLNLKKKWFDMIKSGIKTEEYREIKQYWVNRLCQKLPMSYIDGGNLSDRHSNQQYLIKKFDTVTFHLGYPKATEADKIITYEILDITIGVGNPEWGAKPDTDLFIIKLGKLIKEADCDL